MFVLIYHNGKATGEDSFPVAWSAHRTKTEAMAAAQELASMVGADRYDSPVAMSVWQGNGFFISINKLELE